MGRRPRHSGRGPVVTGVRPALDVPSWDEETLDTWESIDLGSFRKLRLRVQTLDGEALAWLYVLDAYEGGLPSAHYLSVLADAAEHAGAPTDYLTDLRTRPHRDVEL